MSSLRNTNSQPEGKKKKKVSQFLLVPWHLFSFYIFLCLGCTVSNTLFEGKGKSMPSSRSLQTFSSDIAPHPSQPQGSPHALDCPDANQRRAAPPPGSVGRSSRESAAEGPRGDGLLGSEPQKRLSAFCTHPIHPGNPDLAASPTPLARRSPVLVLNPA